MVTYLLTCCIVAQLDFSVAPEQDFVNVTWHISYSGRTPIKHFISNFMSEVNVMYDHDQNETAQVLLQESVEITREQNYKICQNSWIYIRSQMAWLVTDSAKIPILGGERLYGD